MRRLVVALLVLLSILGVSRVEAGPKVLYEKVTTLDESMRVADRLRAAGIDVVFTRTDDRDVALSKRAALSKGTDLLLSIHNNASSSRSARGTEAYYQIGNGFGADLAWSIVRSVSAHTGTAVRGAFTRKGDHGDYYAVLRESPTNSIIVEGAFLSNQGEARQLASSDFRARLANGIADALIGRLVTSLVAQAPGPAAPKATPVGALLASPSRLAASVDAGRAVTVGWTSQLGAGLSYEVWRDGNYLGSTTDRGFVDSGLGAGRHRYEVRTAVMVAGQVVQESRSATTEVVVPWKVVIDPGHGGRDSGAVGKL